MFKIGLTGSIGSGKTTILNLFEKHGFLTFNLDEEAKKLLNKNTEEYKKVVAFFGKKILNKESNIDKKLLAKEAFSDLSKKKALENIIHPALRKNIGELLENSDKSIAIIEGAVIIESGFYLFMDMVVLITCDFAKRVERSCNKFTFDDFINRDRSQLGQMEKAKKSDFIINNNYGTRFLIPQFNLLLNYITYCKASQ